MLACLHRVRSLLRVEVRRRLDHHRVELAFEQTFVAAQTSETRRLLDLELLAQVVCLVLEIVGASDQPVLAGFGEEVRDPASAPATADQADLQLRVLLGAENGCGLQDGEARCGRRSSQERSPREVGFGFHARKPIGALARFKSLTTPRIHSTLWAMFGSVPLHSRETTPSQPDWCSSSMHLRMFSAFTPPPTCTSELPMPVSSPRAAAASAGLTSLMWQCTTYFLSAFRVLDRVVPRDERVPCIEVAPQVFRFEMLEEVLHELEVVRVRPVRLDVDGHLVVLRPGEALAIIVTGHAKDFLPGHARRLKGAIDCIHHRATQLRRKPDGLSDILDAKGGTVRPHHRVGTVDL